ncbi:MAG: branched-chain amino acid ABC transporter permease [Candidatus Bathyarchaeia archaeon]
MKEPNRKYIFILGLSVFLLPLVIKSNYYLMVLNMVALNIIVVVGLNLLIGYAGQISMGHSAFYGMGAYISAIFTTSLGFPPLPTIFFAMVVTGLVAYIIGIPTMKLEGHYLVMATLGFSFIVYIMMVQLDGLTGGPSGFAGIEHLKIGPLQIDTDLKFYFLVWFISLFVIFLSFNLINSRVGRAMGALKSNEIAANCTGINTDAYKVMIFVISAVLASLAGSLYAHHVQFISPDTFSFFYSIQVVTMVVVGGMGSIWGSVLGATILTILPEVIQVFREYNVLTYGIILTGVLVFFPEGIFTGIARTFSPSRSPIIDESSKGGIKKMKAPSLPLRQN